MERFWTSEEIEAEVDKVSGTWVKRRNLREKLKAENNHFVDDNIMIIKANIRAFKSLGAKERMLITYYNLVSNLECKRL